VKEKKMKIYTQLMWFLLFSIVGEAASTLLNLPVPGSIIGMLLLFIALKTKLLKLGQIDLVGKFLLANMTILFLPAGVGIMAHWDAISKYWWQIIVITLVALVVNVAVIGAVSTYIKRKWEGDYQEDDARDLL
jgi:holin-like protein